MSRVATTDTVTLELITGTLRAAREEMEALIGSPAEAGEERGEAALPLARAEELQLDRQGHGVGSERGEQMLAAQQSF